MSRAGAVLFAFVLAALSGCGSDEIEIPDELRGEPTCMWVAGARVHFEDGSSKPIVHPESHTSPAVCTCMTLEEFEAGGWEDDLHEQTLELCEEVAGTYDDPVWNDCQDYFDSGEWLLYVFWDAEGELEPPAAFDPGCVDE